jgi:hypothetical protein
MSAFHAIKAGSKVTIVDRFGKTRKGRAVMYNFQIHAWVLNMGGAHGTPGIATVTNTVKVQAPKADAFTRQSQIINGGAKS